MRVRSVTILIVSLFAVYIIGCDSDIEDDAVPVIPFPTVDPPGGVIAADAIITLNFDYVPENLIVNPGVVTLKGKTVEVSGPFVPGPLVLTVSWADKTTVKSYTVVEPDAEAPKVTGGTTVDGDIDVDQDEINKDRKIVITFNEGVRGHVALQTEDGEDVGWIGKVNWERQAILELVKGKELDCGTTYVIVGKVSDDFENSTDFKVTFSTKRCNL